MNDKISLIIPTYKRNFYLKKCLDSLSIQSTDKSKYEIIVVDNDKENEITNLIKNFRKRGVDLTYVKNVTNNVSSARNLGISLSKYKNLLFIGDDIYVCRDFIKQHLSFLRKYNFQAIILGFTDWYEGNKKINNFMRYIAPTGLQFSYGNYKTGDICPFWMFYTSNISLSKKIIGTMKFDSHYQQYGLEDTDLGYLLHKKNYRIILNENALAYHDHSTCFKKFIRRQKYIGLSAKTFIEKYPELKKDLIKPYGILILIIGFLAYHTKILSFMNEPLYWELSLAYFKYLYYLKVKYFNKNYYNNSL